ncbi:MAG: hypothetical protein IPL65_13015 [Lewinellaceae bacterium]|nr:hypothetical protein [Lewinellaceae bacterium]
MLLLSQGVALWAQKENSNSDRIGSGLDRGPSLEAIERRAYKEQRQGDHNAALGYFAEVIRQDSSRVSAYKAFAASAMELYRLGDAERAYTHLAYRDSSRIDGEMLLKLAEVKFKQDEYETARDLYDMILLSPSLFDDQVVQDAAHGKKDIDWAIFNRPPDSTLQIVHLGSPVNTLYWAEYSSAFHNNKLYFSAYRFPFPSDTHDPRRNLIKVLTAEQSGDTLKTSVQPFNENEHHTAHVTFSRDGQRMYYSECDFITDATLHCDIYVRTIAADSSFGPAQKLPSPINMSEFTSTEPAVGWDDAGNETLYFVSDRPGQGGRDIWSAPILENGYGEPQNLSDINKAGNEVTPSFHSATQTLYFSSNSYMSLGGLDVYKTRHTGNGWSEPKSMGSPINSSYNDVYYSVSPSGRSGFFSSNRRGDYNESEEDCCYDIFKAYLGKPRMIAVTFNKETGDSLSTTRMRLFEVSNDNTKTATETVDEPGNHHAFELTPGRKYMLIAQKPYFTPDTIYCSVPRVTLDEVYVFNLYLDPAHVTLITTVMERKRDGSIVVCDSTFMDLTDYGLVSKPALAPRVQSDSLLFPDQNTYYDTLEFMHRYDIDVNRPGYTLVRPV